MSNKFSSCIVCICLLGITLAQDNALRYFARYEHHGTKNSQAGDHWAVIVAGSNGWYNYRHQADACHAYQVLRRHGFPEDRIITLMYDDIANNQNNPTPGKVINHPLGADVYAGVKIDYRGEDVTPETFLAVISGDESRVAGDGSGRVVKSGPNDHIFINFVDHGAPGLLAFPSSELHASELMRTINKMFMDRRYKQMVFYIEACESGSMFSQLLYPNISVYATTAANPMESSYACYYDQQRNTYLGDVYSVKWMEDSDKEDLGKESLHMQYEIVKSETNTSHVMEYGNKTISTEVVAEFQSDTEHTKPEPIVLPKVPLDAVPSGDVRQSILQRRMLRAETDAEKHSLLVEYENLIKEREEIRMTMHHVVVMATKDHLMSQRIMVNRRELVNFACYEPVAKAFDEHCYDLSQYEYALRNMYALVNLCEEGVPSAVIMDAIVQLCG